MTSATLRQAAIPRRTDMQLNLDLKTWPLLGRILFALVLPFLIVPTAAVLVVALIFSLPSLVVFKPGAVSIVKLKDEDLGIE